MKQFGGWKAVANRLEHHAWQLDQMEARHHTDGSPVPRLNAGQRASLRAIANRIDQPGWLIADEVGMGKTRIAVDLTRAVVDEGGRVAILVPPTLGYQWQAELLDVDIEPPPLLRSFDGFLSRWIGDQEASEGQLGWKAEPVILISHSFANWRLHPQSVDRRWTLLPHVYAHARKQRCFGGRFPRGYVDHEILGDESPAQHRIGKAAQAIVSGLADKDVGMNLLRDLIEELDWSTLLHCRDYTNGSELRPWLERCVGIGLEGFDLLIVDEAHKSRRDGSALSRLMERILVAGRDGRRLGMTATPVELDVAQWTNTLQRIGLPRIERERIETAIIDYGVAAERLRASWRSSAEARSAFIAAADRFQSTLGPYVLRRDKREDHAVRRFRELSGLPYNAYRHEEEIVVALKDLSGPWRQAVCAAESLSIVVGQNEDMIGKRLRLTLGNGHGVAAFLDQVGREPKTDDIGDESEDEDDVDGDSPERVVTGNVPEDGAVERKRMERGAWWRDLIAPIMAADRDALYDHPAILSAVHAIEELTARDEKVLEKVLVFGRFTRPLRALVSLLNAREMFRRLAAGRAWPQSKVHQGHGQGKEDDEWPAVRAAHRQLHSTLDLDELDRHLERQYERQSNALSSFRANLIARVLSGLKKARKAHRSDTTWSQSSARLTEQRSALDRTGAIFMAFARRARKSSEEGDEQRSDLALIARALGELLGASREELATVSDTDCFEAFRELIASAAQRNEGDSDGDGRLCREEADSLWQALAERIRDEFARPQGGFARLMYGGTKPESRRMMQAAFNRIGSFPMVLVAQSTVGREGLNLHKACRTVVLLHPEWNPGVVEQQIGRVDRVGSLWSRMLEEAAQGDAPPAALPQIVVRPVVFQGTYDEYNWSVLRRRWDALRAQLHGVVIAEVPGDEDPEGRELAMELNRSAPNFSPGVR